MHRRAKDGLRAGATAVGVAAGLMVLASTAQTPDGFVRASFGGPLTPVIETPSDVLTIGDGATDTTELAALLKGSTTVVGVPDSPYRAAFEAGATPGPTTPNTLLPLIDPTIAAPAAAPAAPATKELAVMPAPKSVVDSHGRVDCTGAVSCKTDPVTQVTTVTYPDGVVAIVQKINDLTVVAYKTLTEYLPPSVQTLLPPVPSQVPPALAAPPPPPAPTQSVLPETPPVLAPPVPEETLEPAIDPGPPAPDLLEPIDSDRGPRINVTRPPMDFSPDRGGPGAPGAPGNGFPSLDKVRDALDSVVDAVGDAVNKAVGPGASGKASNPSSDTSPDDAGAGTP